MTRWEWGGWAPVTVILSMLLGAVQDTSLTGCKVAICISVLWTSLNFRETELHARPHSKQMTGGAGFGFRILGASYSTGHRLVFVVGMPKVNLGYQSSGAVSFLPPSPPRRYGFVTGPQDSPVRLASLRDSPICLSYAYSCVLQGIKLAQQALHWWRHFPSLRSQKYGGRLKKK